jgi:hypothetical protein
MEGYSIIGFVRNECLARVSPFPPPSKSTRVPVPLPSPPPPPPAHHTSQALKALAGSWQGNPSTVLVPGVQRPAHRHRHLNPLTGGPGHTPGAPACPRHP